MAFISDTHILVHAAMVFVQIDGSHTTLNNAQSGLGCQKVRDKNPMK